MAHQTNSNNHAIATRNAGTFPWRIASLAVHSALADNYGILYAGYAIDAARKLFRP